MLGRRFEGGVELSGGEWQKMALARAYLRDAQLLILDEPTAALDAKSELEVFERFAELTQGKMALLISHRFSTVRMADRIVVLSGGQLIEEGDHQNLMARKRRICRHVRNAGRELSLNTYPPKETSLQGLDDTKASAGYTHFDFDANADESDQAWAETPEMPRTTRYARAPRRCCPEWEMTAPQSSHTYLPDRLKKLGPRLRKEIEQARARVSGKQPSTALSLLRNRRMLKAAIASDRSDLERFAQLPQVHIPRDGRAAAHRKPGRDVRGGC